MFLREHRGRRRRLVPDAAQRERDQRDDDQRVEDDRRGDRRLRAVQLHDVELFEAGEDPGEHGGQHREVLRDVVGDREGRQRAARDEQLLADLHDLDELGRVGVEVDHVPGLFRGRGTGVHRHADVGLGEGGRVVGAVAGHRDELAALLLLLDQRHLVFRRRLGEEVVHAGLLRDRARGQRVVAGDHDGADAHRPHLGEPLGDALLDDVLQVDDAERPRGLARQALRDDQRRAAGRGDPVDDVAEVGRGSAPVVPDPLPDRARGALADLAPVGQVDAAHPGLRGERHEYRTVSIGCAARPGRARGC